jgi:hypothetical protein
VHPAHPLGAGLGLCDRKRRRYRIQGGYGEAVAGEQVGECSGAAAEIREAAGAELIDLSA